ncbi:hypothetical protein [Flavihumibacter sp. UBA7668]|uniref:hypothetical protein n=1 Tax=Flavihumibacter sp. UBA7668 TaxID=1946542 RepID=UPI0025BE706D|nr:hypothetical protein [Flavihumibacter sp. UBA7668]
MQNHFCFIIPRTPKKFRTGFREFLWQQTLQSLKTQEYNNWQVLVVGEWEEIGDDRFHFLEHDLVEKRKKLCYAMEFIRSMPKQPDYLIRLDDDDLISSTVLERVKEETAACIADRYHSFVEIVTGKVSQQKRNWLANTVAHKTSHAFQLMDPADPDSYLLVQDHSQAWHPYYSGLSVYYTSKLEPLYLRILAPGSITSKAASQSGDAATDYLRYLLGFGTWSTGSTALTGFEQALPALRGIAGYLSETGIQDFHFPALALLKNRLNDLKTAIWHK